RESETVVLGFVIWHRRHTPLEDDVRDWLSYLPKSNHWEPPLSLPALYGLIDARGLRERDVVNDLKRYLPDALKDARRSAHIGRLRSQCIAFGERLLRQAGRERDM